MEAEQSSYYREYPAAFGQKREIVGVGQSDTANNRRSRCALIFLQALSAAIVFRYNNRIAEDKNSSKEEPCLSLKVGVGELRCGGVRVLVRISIKG